MCYVRTWTRHVRHGIASLFTLVLISSPVVAYGQTVTAMWDPSPPSDEVTSYQVCISATSMSCNVQLASVSDPQTTYTFTPTPGVVHYVAIRAINSVGAGSYSTETSFSIPSFIQPVNQSSPAGVAITPLNMSVTDPDGSARNFTHTGLPTGLALNATTGQITGTPSAAGTYNVTIFVTDSLVTVSRSFVWTITALVADTTAPALTITSHTNGQTLSTASVTISGTASDSGRGGNGVSVTVNGQAATGGSATASATASWSRKLTLAQGANTITVQATDSRGNIATQSITLNNSSAPVTSVALTSTVASPQNTGTAITFIANSSGGVAPHQFKFLVQPAGGAAQVVQDWSAATTYTWTPATAGAYTVTLWARSAGVTAEDPVPASPEDTFSRANWPNLGPNWTCLTANEPIIENGFARSSLDDHYYCKWNAHTMAADHCAAFKVGNATYGNGVFVRGSGAGATRDAYRFAASAPGHNSFFIKEVDDAVTAVLAPPTLMNWIPGDEGRVCATGTSTVTITLERKSVGSPNWVQITLSKIRPARCQEPTLGFTCMAPTRP